MAQPTERDESLQYHERREGVLARIRELSIAVDQARSERIGLEDEFLRLDPEARKLRLLDYLRRGRLTDPSCPEIMPQIIDSLPKLLDGRDGNGRPYIDFESEEYDEKKECDRLIVIFQEIEREIVSEDRRYRAALESAGLKARAEVYLDEKRFATVINRLKDLRQAISDDSIQEKINKAQGKTKEELRQNEIRRAVLDIGKVNILLNPEIIRQLNLDEALRKLGAVAEKGTEKTGAGSPVKDFIYQFIYPPTDKRRPYNAEKHGFNRYPKLSEYHGDAAEPESVDLSQGRKRADVEVVSRASIPEVNRRRPVGLKESGPEQDLSGVVIIDGNIGYNEAGEINDREGLTIIDHHNQLEIRYPGAKKYDTATVMMARIIEDAMGRSGGSSKARPDRKRWKAGMGDYLERFGARAVFSAGSGQTREARKLRVCVNHLDSDSVLSAWAFRNPRLAMRYKEIITAISTCGDFLLGSGVMDTGATARDYEYILRNLIEVCQGKAREMRETSNPKIASKRSELKDVERRLEQTFSAVGLEFSGPEEPWVRIDNKIAEAEQADDGLKALLQEMSNADPEKKQSISKKIKEHRESNPRLRILYKLKKTAGDLLKKQAAILKEIEQEKNNALTPAENTLILNYLLDRVADIIENPFRYRDFLETGRKKEMDTMAKIDQAYREGRMEIRPDDQDPGIIIIEPGSRQKELPAYDSIDGLYYYLRRNPLLNQRVIVSREGGFVSVAVNTQHADVLNRYDFNALVALMKQKERETIASEIAKLESQLSTAKPADKKSLEKKIKEMSEALQNNIQGKLWRNRTQMIFCMKTNIPFSEIMNQIRSWKQQMNADQPKAGKKGSALKP